MELMVQPREGTLTSANFPALFYSVLSRKEAAILTVTGETSEKSIHLNGGRPTFATSSDRDDRLGQVFFKAGRISLKELMDSVEASVSQGKRLGTLLVERKLIEPEELVEGVLSQVRNIICSLFHWTHGRYRYIPGPPSQEMITLRLSAADIVLEGIRRISSWERIWEAVGGLDAVYRTSPQTDELARQLKLTLEEWTLLSHCEAPIPLGVLCSTSKLKDYEVCRLVWAFLTLGVLNRVSPRP